MMAGKVRVVAEVDEGLDGMRALVKKHKIRFLLVGYDEGAKGDLSMQMYNVHYGHSYLANGLLLPSGRPTHLWSGYNRWTLKGMEADAFNTLRSGSHSTWPNFPRSCR